MSCPRTNTSISHSIYLAGPAVSAPRPVQPEPAHFLSDGEEWSTTRLRRMQQPRRQPLLNDSPPPSSWTGVRRTLSQADFDAIADRLNGRPRQTLGFKTPSQALAEVLR